MPPIHHTPVSPPEQSPALSTSESTATTILETPTEQTASDGFRVGAQQRTTHSADVMESYQMEGVKGRRASWGVEEDEDLARKARESGRRRSSSESWVDGDGRVSPSFTFPPAPTRSVSPPITHAPASPPITQPPAPASPPPPPFSFGTFRINSPTGPMLGTPTTELGAFEYPLDAVSPAIRRLVADDHGDHTGNSLLPPGFAPGLRRTSSTSTVPVSPAGGRRPSVVHSNTVPQADAGRRLSLILGSDGLGLGPHSASAVVAAEEEDHTPTRRASDTVERRASESTSSPFSARRPSILGFAHQIHPSGPIPPSLAHLGPSLRRGSIPCLPMPPRDRQSSISSMASSRGSFSGPVVTGQGTQDEHVTVSTAYLYQRRASLASTSRGLLSSNPPPTRPGMTPTQRQGSVSSTSSDHSTGSRESTTTLRDFRTSFSGDARPLYERHGSSNESTATERNRRMSLPSPGLGGSSTGWEPLRQNTSAAPNPINPGFSFGISMGSSAGRPFTLGTLPSAHTQADMAHEGSGGDGSPKDADAGRTTFSPSLISSTSSSEELSDTTSDTPDTNPSDPPTSTATPGRRGFRLSQRGIEARERRRSSRMSAVGSVGGNTLLQTIPSDYVVDFTSAGSARSSLSSGRGAGARIGEERIGEGIPVSASEDEDVLGGASGEAPVEEVTTSFRAFAFPPRSGSVGSIK